MLGAWRRTTSVTVVEPTQPETHVRLTRQVPERDVVPGAGAAAAGAMAEAASVTRTNAAHMSRCRRSMTDSFVSCSALTGPGPQARAGLPPHSLSRLLG